MSKLSAWFYLLLRILSDIAAVLLAFGGAFYIHFLTPPASLAAVLIVLTAYYKLLILVVLIWLVVFNLAGLYRYNLEPFARISGPDRPFRILLGVTLAAVVTYIVTYFYSEYFLIRQSPRPLIFYAWLIALVVVFMFRFLISKLQGFWHRQNRQAAK